MNRGLLTVGLIALVTFLTIVGVRSFQRRNQIELPAPRVTDIMPERSMKDILDEPLLVRRFEFTKGANPVCQEFWRQVVHTRLYAWMREVDEIGWHRPDECADDESEVLSRLARGVQISCLKRHSDRTGLEQQTCQQAMFSYRIRLADELTKGQKNFLDMQIALLVTKILSDQLAQEEGERAALTDFWAMTEALEKREAEWFPVRKLLVVALFNRQRIEQDGDLRAQIGERLTQQLEAATVLNGHDEKILEVELMRQAGLGDEGTTEIEKFALKYPDFALAQYHWASVLCKEGNRPECLSALEKAVSLKPEDARFRDSLERVRQIEKVTDPALFALEPQFDIFNW
jgi:hypothetical protein